PYDFWTPGPKVYDQSSLQSELYAMLHDPLLFAADRKQIRDIVHVYSDDQSSERIWKSIDRYLTNRDSTQAATAQSASEMDQLKRNVKNFISKCIEAGRVEE